LIDGLEYLHTRGCSHLDLKPENLLLGEDFQLKIIDFDLSHVKGDNSVKSRGTANLRAPEVLAGKVTDPQAADIFSAGILLFIFMTRGSYPYIEGTLHRGENLWEALQNDLEKFWKVQERNLKCVENEDSKDFRELFELMTRAKLDQRATLADIRRSNWFKGSVFTPEELKEAMSERITPLQT
jgi:serine/threonine protein kinase